MSEITSKLKLDPSEFNKGMLSAMSSVGDFTSSTKTAMDEVSKGMEESIDNTSELSEKTEASSQKQGQSWSRVGKSVAAVALISNGLFKSMVENSPSLSAAFAEMNFMFNETFMILGEALAPLIEDYVVPAIEKLTEFIINLTPEIQQLIAGAIGVIAVFTAASSVLGIFGISLTALLGPVGLVVLGIAAIALAYHTNFGGMKDHMDGLFGSMKDSLTGFVDDHSEQFGRIFDLFKELWAIIEPIVDLIAEKMIKDFAVKIEFAFNAVLFIVDFFLDFLEGAMKIINGFFSKDTDLMMEGFVDLFSVAFETISGVVEGLFTYLKEAFGAFEEFMSNLITSIFGDDIGDKFGVFMDVVKTALNTVIDWINEKLIGVINNILVEVADLVDLIPGVDKPDWSIADLPTLHDGGVVPGAIGQEVMIKALGGEIVTNPMKGQPTSNFSSRSVNVTNKIIINNPQFQDRRSERRLVQNMDMQLRRSQSKYPSGRA